ncbi:MAG: aminotransferase [Planktomarina sp.]|nr:aminotransferase [Planktomarina sp.]
MTTRTERTFRPPVMEAASWIDGKNFSDLSLINVSQAAPVDPPPDVLIDYMAEVLREDSTHLYGPVLGIPELRSEIATRWSEAYESDIKISQVGITSGCNQAFAASIAMLCTDGDEVILPTPFYFNHKMWLDMAGVKTVMLQCAADMVPSPTDAASLINERTRAIVLVSPNNPCGVEYSNDTIMAFYDLAQKFKIALIIDETYRDFHSHEGMPHQLFQNDKWEETLVHLYSFSKAYRLTGHRVGAIITSKKRLTEIEKFLDTVSICPNQIGQKAALWGMQNLNEWLSNERKEILTRKQAIINDFFVLKQKGWELMGVGAYFAYVRHPFLMDSDQLCKRLVDDLSILTLPGTMFVPKEDHSGKRQIRIAFANIDAKKIKTLFNRLATLIE